jgi:4'-phosphopantetheinyl transferase
MVSVFSIYLDKHLTANAYSQLLAKTSEKGRYKYSEFRHKEDAHRSLLAEFLIRYIAGTYLKISDDELIIGQSYFGKPYFIGFENFHFNLSHSGDWVVCAISDDQVGIDIEEVIPINLGSMVGALSPAEQSFLNSQKKELQLSLFYELFTLKESFVKQTGEGLSRPLHSFNIVFKEKQIMLEDQQKIHKPVFFKQYDISPTCRMAVCAHTDDFAALISVSLPEMLDYFIYNLKLT